MSKRPKTGEKRRVRQPFKADSLPVEQQEEIIKLRAEGNSWAEIERKTGIAKSSLHRWYDVRIQQVKDQVVKEAQWAREVAAAFTRSGYEKLPDAVKNALADQIFGLMQAADAPGDSRLQGALLEFMDQLTKLKRAEVQQEKVEIEKRKLSIAEGQLEVMRAKVRGLSRDLQKKKLTPLEARERLDEIYGITGE